MGRPKGTTDVTDAERRRILELRRQGLRYEQIARIVGRGLSTLAHVLRGTGLNGKMPPRPRKTKRDQRIAYLMLVKDWSGSRVGRLYGITATRACEIAREALGLCAKQQRRARKRQAKK